ncbi:MAG: exosortase/archaeosortase family protein [Verrucomicrobiae bacterium]|nr:exosortase/archaeosortase family protein [Verrucomicrobiae bacterium]
MTADATKKQPPLLGLLWPHEVPLLAVMVYGVVFQTSSTLRGSSWTVAWFGAAILAGVVMLALRCPDEWRILPNKAFFFTLAAAWVAMFTFLGNSTFGYVDTNSIFAWAFDIYTAPDSEAEFALLMPFVVLALYWWRREELVAKPAGTWSPALLLVAAGLCAHLLGYVIQQPRLSYTGFFIGLYGLTGLAWGKHWLKASFFPFFLLVFCIPGGGTDWLTLRMRLLVAWIVAGIAHLGLAPDLVRDGNVLMDGNRAYAYEVAAACSGIRSLTALLALTTVYGFICFKSLRSRGAMILSAFPLAILGNVMRLCFTIMVAEIGGQGAGKAVETNAGFVTFAVAIGCVYFLGRWLERFEPKPPEPAPPASPAPPPTGGARLRSAPVFSGLVLALMGLTALLICHIKSQQRQGEPGVKTQTIAGSHRLEVLMPRSVPGYTSEILTNAEAVLERQLPKDSSYRCLVYVGEDKTWMQMTTVLMGKDRSSVHSPYICLVGQGWAIDTQHTTVEPIRMERPMAYDLPVNKLLATKQVADANGNPVTLRGIYVYWYVDGSHYTPNSKLWMGWWLPRDLLLHGLLERWAYISMFEECLPGQEEATYERMKKLIASTVPEFQLVPKRGG